MWLRSPTNDENLLASCLPKLRWQPDHLLRVSRRSSAFHGRVRNLVSCIAGVLRALHDAGKLGATADWPFLDDDGGATLDADIRGVGNHRGGWLHGLGAFTVGARPPVLGRPSSVGFVCTG